MDVRWIFLLITGTLLFSGCTKVSPQVDFLFPQSTTSTSSFLVLGAPNHNSVINVDVHTLTFVSAIAPFYRAYVGPASGVDCSIIANYGGPYPVANSFPIDLSGSSDNDYRVCILTEDAAGNLQAVADVFQRDWKLDRTSPTTTEVSPTTTPAASNELFPVFTVSSTPASEVHTYRWKWGDIGSTNCAVVSGYSAVTPVASAVPLNLSASPDGNYRLCVLGRDEAGNEQTTAVTRTWTKDTVAPSAPSVTLLSSSLTNNTSAQLSLSCTGIAEIFVTESASVPTENDPAWAACISNVNWMMSATEGTKTISVWGRDAAKNRSLTAGFVTVTLDTSPPVLSSFIINSGNATATTPFLSLQLQVNDQTTSGLSVRFGLANGSSDCQAEYVNNNWVTDVIAGSVQTYGWTLPWDAATYKVCAWAKDQLGQVSVISPATGTVGVNTGTIQLLEGNAPSISNFSVTNAGNGTTSYAPGEAVNISWTVDDIDGLIPIPETLEYTTDNASWINVPISHAAITAGTASYSAVQSGFTAPGAGFFRMRVRARDDLNRTSPMVYSTMQNTGAWSIYAGNIDRGIGGASEWLRLDRRHCSNSDMFAIHPTTSDLYLTDDTQGIVRVDSKTGLSSTFLRHGTTNLGANGTLNLPTDRLNLICPGLAFDKEGRLYIREGGDPFSASGAARLIYRFTIGPSTTQYRLYAGGISTASRGTVRDNTAVPGTIFVSAAEIHMAETGDLYFSSFCSSDTYWNTSNPAMALRILKLSQNAAGEPTTISLVAGDCSVGTPSSAVPAVSTPLSASNAWAANAWSIMTVPGVDTVFLRNRVGTIRKIESGVVNSMSLTGVGTGPVSVSGMAYSKVQGVAYVPTRDGGLAACSAMGACTSVAGVTPSFGCWNDDVLGANACVNASSGVRVSPDGHPVFIDNSAIDFTFEAMPYRVRMIDNANMVRTLAGRRPAAPHSSDPLQNAIEVQSIYYKKSSEPAQTYFPEALYFTSPVGSVFGRIGSSGNTSILWGNQQLLPFDPTPSTVSAARNVNVTNGRMTMNFDPRGYPWIRVGNGLLQSLEYSGGVVQNIERMSGGSNAWFENPPSISSGRTGTSLSNFGGDQNLVFDAAANMKLILFGANTTPSITPATPLPALRSFDFFASTIGYLMGATGNTATPDNLVPMSQQTSSFSAECAYTGCAIQHAAANSNLASDSVIFSEGSKLRYLGQSSTPALNTLTTLITAPSGTKIVNFILSLDGNRIFLLIGDNIVNANRGLYCLALNSSPTYATAMCPDTTGWGLNVSNISGLNSHKLGPPDSFATILKGGNQMTWKDNNTLLISNTQGEIYQYDTSGISPSP